MAEEVNSKAPAAGSSANPLRNSIGKPIGRRGHTPRRGPHGGSSSPRRGLRRRRLRHAAGLRGPFIEVPGYDLPNGVPRSAPGNSDKRPENEFTPAAGSAP